MSIRPRAAALAALVLMGAATLAGCGGDDHSSTSNGSENGSSESSSQDALDKAYEGILGTPPAGPTAPPSGKRGGTVWVVSCGQSVPTCATPSQAAADAAKAAGFDASEPTAWAAEGLLPYLPADGQDLLFERITHLSAQGSRVAVEAFGAGFFDPEYLASRRERVRQLREQAGVPDDAPDVADLWFIEERTEVTDWFSSHGWEVSAIDAADLMTRFNRATDDDTTPRTTFVEARFSGYSPDN